MLGLGCLWILLDPREISPLKSTDHPSTSLGAGSPRTIRDRIFILTSLALSLTGLLLIALVALNHGTTASIRTPWPLMPGWTLPLVGLLWILALATAWRVKSTLLATVQTACAIGGTLVIAPMLYRIGYGFDGFLHIAGEKVLLATGTLVPTPPYYMGQYVFVTWLARLMDLDVALIDRWLVPVLAAVLIPAALALVAGRTRATTLIALIIMPLGAFVATTPHGFATVLAITAILLTIGTTGRRDDGTTGSDPVRPVVLLVRPPPPARRPARPVRDAHGNHVLPRSTHKLDIWRSHRRLGPLGLWPRIGSRDERRGQFRPHTRLRPECLERRRFGPSPLGWEPLRHLAGSLRLDRTTPPLDHRPLRRPRDLETPSLDSARDRLPTDPC